VTLGRLALGSLLQPEQNLDATEQLKRWTLAQKVFKAVYPVELSADEIELIKKQIAKRGHPEWTGQAVELLDPVAARKAK
jgi:hypothetical protein